MEVTCHPRLGGNLPKGRRGHVIKPTDFIIGARPVYICMTEA